MSDISELDVFRAANQMIRQHGPAARERALIRARELAEEGEEVGAAVFVRIVKAIDELGRERRTDESLS